ncbi:MAG: hypothetical protein NXH82_01505, partial [Rhodobacteraceae bacterium]|nr:hypothetical protein [Paracoccaceae bacterium]
RRSIETNQTAHISLQISSMSNNVETHTTHQRQNTLSAIKVSHASDLFVLRLVSVLCVSALSRPSGAPLVHLCAAGEGGSTVSGRYPQPLFSRNVAFFSYFHFFVLKQRVIWFLPVSVSAIIVFVRRI